MLLLLALVVLAVPVVVPAEEAVPVADQEVLAATLAAVAGLLLPEAVAWPGWLAAEVAARVAADSLSLLLAWLLLPVLVLLRLVALWPWLLPWLWR